MFGYQAKLSCRIGCLSNMAAVRVTLSSQVFSCRALSRYIQHPNLAESSVCLDPTKPKIIPSSFRSTLNTEYKLKFRPFSDYTYVDGHFTGARDVTDGGEAADRSAAAAPPPPWYEEVVELRKKASSYKVRAFWRLASTVTPFVKRPCHSCLCRASKRQQDATAIIKGNASQLATFDHFTWI